MKCVRAILQHVAVAVTVSGSLAAGSAQAATLAEVNALRDRIIVESGIQAFGPNPVRGAWELYLLGKQVWWAAKAGAFAFDVDDPTATVLLASRPAPVVTASDIDEAYLSPPGTASVAMVDLMNDLILLEEELTANILAYRTAIHAFEQAKAKGQFAVQVARKAEAEMFGAAITSLSAMTLPVMDAIAMQHAMDGLGNPVLTAMDEAAFLLELNTTGLPMDEFQGLLDLGAPLSAVLAVQAHTAAAPPGSAVGIDLLDVFAFGGDVNAAMPDAVVSDLSALIPMPEPAALALFAAGGFGFVYAARRRNH